MTKGLNNITLGKPESSQSLIIVVKSTALAEINCGLNVDMIEFSNSALRTEIQNDFNKSLIYS